MSGFSAAGLEALEVMRRRIRADRRAIRSYKPRVIATKHSHERVSCMRARLADLTLELHEVRARPMLAKRREVRAELRVLVEVLKAGEDRLQLGYLIDERYEHEDKLLGARIAVRLDTLEVHAIERLTLPRQEALFK